MKRLLMIALTLTAILSLTVTVEADGLNNRRVDRAVNRQSDRGIFSRLMELERRKNAALRLMFGRR